MRFTGEFVRVFLEDLGYAAPILLSLILIVVIIGLIIGRIEGWNRFDAFYHAFINATTVGYGDFRPASRAGKLLSIVNALVGLILTGIIVAIGLHAAEMALEAV